MIAFQPQRLMPRQRVGEHAHAAQALDAVVAAGEHDAEREAEDHGVGVERADAPEVQVGRRGSARARRAGARRAGPRSSRRTPQTQRGDREAAHDAPCRTRLSLLPDSPLIPPMARAAVCTIDATGFVLSRRFAQGRLGQVTTRRLRVAPARLIRGRRVEICAMRSPPHFRGRRGATFRDRGLRTRA